MNGRRPISGALLGAALLLATACGGGGGGSGAGSDGKGGDSGKADTNKPSQAVVTIAPKDGADGVATSGDLRITADKGKLTEVKVADTKGNPVEGKIVDGGAGWTPAHHLAASTKYKVHAVAKDSEGRASAKDVAFTTLVPKNTFIGQFTPEDGSKVGVGMPFSVHFTRGITHPEDVEKAIEITTEPSVPVEGHWFGNDRLDFRPEKYWAAGTEVTVKLNLDGVEGRPGVYGKQAKTVKFTIGRSQVSTVDAKTHMMTVKRDGKTIKKVPITTGKPGYSTWNGQMVISEKLTVTRMNGETVGYGGEYDIKDVPHAMRLTTSGTFIHGNYWGGGAFGNYNASHGCVGLRDVRGGYDSKVPAAWFFNSSMIGDVVEVKNSQDRTVAPDNGFNGWNMSWEKWKA
ncbi:MULTISPECIES: Ig-like domain-containing protein [unclassified Streptomyces]|uniref:L,D-transpeptidase n=1 Tax=unclassified Streptomyces TaxID=2593676 RepID=UPI0022564275|nr:MULTISPECIES: Ig-like domain-containing protein [unclassified Streptomyces]MCX5439737.1 Ig-like domain-containing protein [Streptomyces sp. NBC_00063]WSE17285.1 Ig-like domain-containing protein [Streptomyces sp. NBC_01397]WUB93822.1 Ig-like domain-containing protein [Streptomyces sp. NBC_00569]